MAKFIDEDNSLPLSIGNIKQDMEYWINSFMEDKATEKIADKTTKSYSNALKTFKDFVERNANDNIMSNVGATFVNRYIIEYQSSLAKNKLQKEGDILDKKDKALLRKIINQKNEKFLGKNSASFDIYNGFESTLIHRQTVVKMLLSYISHNNSDNKDYTLIFKNLATIKKTQKFTEYLTPDEIDAVVDYMQEWVNKYHRSFPDKDINNAYRDALLLLIYALTGARSAEVVQIKLKDITYFNHKGRGFYIVKIANGKGGKIREIAVLATFMEQFVNYFKKNLPSDEYYIGSIKKGDCYTEKHIHEDTIRRFANNILKELDINKSGLHVFRRGYATKEVIENKKDLSIVAKQLGNTVAILEAYYIKNDIVSACSFE